MEAPTPLAKQKPLPPQGNYDRLNVTHAPAHPSFNGSADLPTDLPLALIRIKPGGQRFLDLLRLC